MEKMYCGNDNVQAFNRRLRESFPAFHALAKELHQAGLIDGLRGASIESLAPNHTPSSARASSAILVEICAHCAHWHRDTVGDGTGIGRCDINTQPSRLKWPNQNACHHFGEKQ